MNEYIYIQTSSSYRRSVLGVHSKDWCWSWNFNTLATWWEELTHWKRPWCWQRLRAGREGDDRGWDGWMTSVTRWTWVWVNSRCWWWTGRPGVLRFMGSQRVRHDCGTELIWTDISLLLYIYIYYYYYYFNMPQFLLQSGHFCEGGEFDLKNNVPFKALLYRNCHHDWYSKYL